MRLLIDLHVVFVRDGIEVKSGLLAFHRPVTRDVIRARYCLRSPTLPLAHQKRTSLSR